MSGFLAITAFLDGTLLTLSDVYVGMEKWSNLSSCCYEI